MLNIVTYNIRFPWDGDGINSFVHRSGMVVSKIKKEAPDVICFQEGVDSNIDHLSDALPEYHIVFNQRNADLGGEGLATAYRKDKFRLLELDYFWLSPTPYVPASRFEGQSSCPRICQSVTLKRRSDGKLFRLYNIHLDHVGDAARILGIKAVLDRVAQDKSKMELPFFILGDFNALPHSQTIDYCNNGSPVPIADLTRDIPVSFHGFGNKDHYSKIDYIYADEQSASLESSVCIWDDCKNGIYLSDHYPISLSIQL